MRFKTHPLLKFTLSVFNINVFIYYRWELYLYDSEMIKHEKDDPLDAILFHYPFVLPPQHILFTCGHLMSIVKFCQEFFSESTRYILSMRIISNLFISYKSVSQYYSFVSFLKDNSTGKWIV